MPRNGSGVYSLPAGNPVITGTIISSSWANTTLQDIANALTQSQARDGQTPITGNLDMDGFHHTNVGDATAGDQYAVVHQVQESAYTWCGVAGGTGDAITLSPSPGITSYVAGQRFQFEVLASNTTAVTVSVSGLTAKQLVKNEGIPLVANDLIANSVVEVIFAGDDKFHLFGAAGTDNTFSNVDITNDLTVGGDTTVHNLTVDGGTLNFTNGGDINLPEGSVDPDDLSAATLALIASLVSSSSGSPYSVRGLTAVNNAGSPNTQYDIDASLVVTFNPSTNAVSVINSVSMITCDISVAGPTANGRDQAGAFSANSWVYFYYIYNLTGPTLALISSATAPENGGPTLPSGYTQWALATEIRILASGFIRPTYCQGASVYATDTLFAPGSPSFILVDGSATSNTPIDLSSYIPPNCLNFTIFQGTSCDTNGAGTISWNTIVSAGNGTAALSSPTWNTGGLAPSGFTALYAADLTIPNISQTMSYYTIVTAGASPKVNMALTAYAVPNGDL